MKRLFPLFFRPGKMSRCLRWLTYLVVFYAIGSAPAWADDGKYAPNGVGGLITIPNLAGDRGKTLFESYSMARYQIYTDLGGISDVPKEVMAYLYQMLSLVAFFLTKLAVGLTWWQVQLTGTSTGASGIGKGMQSTAATLNVWVLPSCLAVGACIAYVKSKTGQNAFSQIMTCVTYALAAVFLATAGTTVLGAVDSTRVALSNSINAAGGQAIATSDAPFVMPGTNVKSGDEPTNASRAEGDAVWRAFFVVPWCQEQFGSQQTCKDYGYAWLNAPNMKARQDQVLRKISAQSHDAGEYIKGNNPADRFAVAVLSAVLALLGCLVLGVLALLALMPWVLACLLAFGAVIFLSIGCIPGWPRRVCNDFLATELGLTLTSALSGAVLTGTLLAMLGATNLVGEKGWLPGMLFMVTALAAGLVGRKRLEQLLVGSSGSHMGALSALVGGRMAARSLGRLGRSAAASGAGRAIKSRTSAAGDRVQQAQRSFEGSRYNLPGRAASAGQRFYQAKTAPARAAVRTRAAKAGQAVKARTPGVYSTPDTNTTASNGQQPTPARSTAGTGTPVPTPVRAARSTTRYEQRQAERARPATAPGATHKNNPGRYARTPGTAAGPQQDTGSRRGVDFGERAAQRQRVSVTRTPNSRRATVAPHRAPQERLSKERGREAPRLTAPPPRPTTHPATAQKPSTTTPRNSRRTR